MQQYCDTLAKSAHIEGNCATRVRKSVRILTLELRYKSCVPYFSLAMYHISARFKHHFRALSVTRFRTYLIFALSAYIIPDGA